MAVNAEQVQIQQQQQPAALQQELNDILRRGQELSQEPYRRYPGELVARPNQIQRQARTAGAESVNRWLPFLQQAQQGAQGVQPSYTQNYQNYMNPYENAAIRNMTADVTRNYTENVLPQIESYFIKRGQHGASAARKLAEKSFRNMNTEIANKAAQMRTYGYEMGARQHQAEQEQRMKLAELMAGLGRQSQASGIADIGLLQSLGGEQQEFEQNALNAAYNRWLQGEAHPYKMLQLRQSIAQGLPFAGGSIYETLNLPQVQHQVNRAGNLSSLALALLGARRRGIFGGEYYVIIA